MTSIHLDIGAELVSNEPASQNNALLAVIALISAGRDTTSYVSQICQHILGNKNIEISLRLKAYDVLQAANLSEVDYGHIIAAIGSDLNVDTSPEVHIAALKALRNVPNHILSSFLVEKTAVLSLKTDLEHQSPSVRAEAALTIAHAISFDGILRMSSQMEDLQSVLKRFVLTAAKMLRDENSEVVVAASLSFAKILSQMAKKLKSMHLIQDQIANKNSKFSEVAAMSLSIARDIVIEVDDKFAEILSRLLALPVIYTLEVPKFLVAYLDTKYLISKQESFDIQPAEALGHQFDEIAYFFASCSTSFDPAMVFEAAKGMLDLVKVCEDILGGIMSKNLTSILMNIQIDATSAVLQSQLPKAIQASIDSTNIMEGRYKNVAQQGLLSMLLSHVDALPASQQAALFIKLPPMIAALPSSRQRLKSLVRLWSGVVSYEWSTEAYISTLTGVQQAESAVNRGGELHKILLEKHLKQCIAGNTVIAKEGETELEGIDPPHSRYADPHFREEVVGSLLYILLNHQRPISGLSSDSSLEATSANSALVIASGIHASASAMDWLLTAKVALQDTKPCLGWDRVAGISTTGSTACVDLWLQLLLRCINVASKLQRRIGMMPRYGLVQPQNSESSQSEDNEVDDEKRKDDIITLLERNVSVLEGEFQGLLLQIAINWRALHPVVRPRAIWLCASHLKLQSVLDTTWSALADALRGLLLEGDHATSANPVRHMMAVAEGSLRHKRVPTKSGSIQHEATVAAGSGEAEEVGILALERLARIVVKNHKDELHGRLQDIAGMLQALVAMCLSRDHACPMSIEQLNRIHTMLNPVSTSGRETSSGGPESKVMLRQSVPDKVNQVEEKLVLIDLEDLDEKQGGRAWASYPSTVPSASSLMHSDVVKTYQNLISNLQAAVTIDDDIIHSGKEGAVEIGFPSLAAVVDVLDSDRENSPSEPEKMGWCEVTGAMSPIGISFCHVVEPSSSTIRLKCSISNNIAQTLPSLEVQILLGGPISMHRRPLSYKFGHLQQGEKRFWEIPCRCTNFGWPTVQALLVLPLDCSDLLESSYQVGVIRCKTYTISPLQLISKASRPVHAAEFFQMWQTFPHRSQSFAVPRDPGIQGVVQVLSSIEEAGLICATKVTVPVSGGTYAAYFGLSWSGHAMACVVRSIPMAHKAQSSRGRIILQLNFASDVAEVISPMRGHENELVVQLTKGKATPVSAPTSITHLKDDEHQESSQDQDTAIPSTFSFFKSMITSSNGREEEEEEDRLKDAGKKDKENRVETSLLTAAALESWNILRQSK